MLGLMGLFSLLVAGSTVGSLMMDDTETEIEREDDVADPEQADAANLLACVGWQTQAQYSARARAPHLNDQFQFRSALLQALFCRDRHGR